MYTQDLFSLLMSWLIFVVLQNNFENNHRLFYWSFMETRDFQRNKFVVCLFISMCLITFCSSLHYDVTYNTRQWSSKLSTKMQIILLPLWHKAFPILAAIKAKVIASISSIGEVFSSATARWQCAVLYRSCSRCVCFR